MPKARFKNRVIAESDRCLEVEGNQYFPPQDVHREYLRESDHHTVCSWKGTASYYDVVVEGEVSRNAAWYYAEPKQAALSIAGYVAFWKGVTVEAS